jgi:hypothetical protein
MSAFQPYAGAYEFDGGEFAWRCYATARVYEVRLGEHAPFPSAPRGRKWVLPERQHKEPDVVCLVDESVGEFSRILLQVEPRPAAFAPAQQVLASA